MNSNNIKRCCFPILMPQSVSTRSQSFNLFFVVLCSWLSRRRYFILLSMNFKSTLWAMGNSNKNNKQNCSNFSERSRAHRNGSQSCEREREAHTHTYGERYREKKKKEWMKNWMNEWKANGTNRKKITKLIITRNYFEKKKKKKKFKKRRIKQKEEPKKSRSKADRRSDYNQWNNWSAQKDWTSSSLYRVSGMQLKQIYEEMERERE